MKHHALTALLALIMLATGALALPAAQARPAAISAPVITPTPKWQYKGCEGSWCQTGWYASPAVADLNGDGKPEVIWSAYSVKVVDGATGNLVWSVRSGHDRSYTGSQDVGRTWPGIVVADVEGDGTTEIVTAHGGGWVGVYDAAGNFKPGWPRQPYTSEIRSLAVADLDGDGTQEIVVARASGGNHDQWTVLQSNGATRAGWPRLSSSQPGYGWGAYNQNVGVADIDGDGRGEIVGPSDVHYISAFNDDGSQIVANARYNNYNPRGPKFWSQVGVHMDDAVDLRGYADCGSEHRPNFANSAPSITDMDGDGTREIVVVGNVHNCGTDPYTDLGYIPFIFNADRSRWAGSGFNWTAVPPLGGDSGAPLSQDYNIIQSALPNPVPADLDGDGVLELLYASYDGKLHAYWMDKTQHGSWPFDVRARFGGDLAFASEPIVADLDRDGKAEVIFGTWPRNDGGRIGKLIVADWEGKLIQEVTLPAPLGGGTWNGVLGAPTIANLDADADLELVVGTVSSGIVAYELPGSANARVLWGSGRGSFQRTGTPPASATIGHPQAWLGATPPNPQPGDEVTFRMGLSNPASGVDNALQFQSTLPTGLTFVGGSLSVTAGSASESGGAITWSGVVPPDTTITLTFRALVSAAISSPTVITSQGQISGDETIDLRVVLIVKGHSVWVPAVRR